MSKFGSGFKTSKEFSRYTTITYSLVCLSFGIVVFPGLVFAIGGEGVNIAECYDPREGSWSVIPSPMKCKRGGMAAVALHDEIYAIGNY